MLQMYILVLFFYICTACNISLVGESVLWSQDDQNDYLTKNGLKSLKGVLLIKVPHVRIRTLCANTFKDFNKLEGLFMEFNFMENIQPKAFNYTDNLEYLSIIHNEVVKIDVGVFNGLKIEYIDLSSNKINEIHPHTFDDMPNLKNIFMENNKIAYIDNRWFHDTPNLYALDMSNMIAKIPSEAFVNFIQSSKMLIQIYLTGNSIGVVHPGAFQN